LSATRRIACLVLFGVLLCAAGIVAYQCSRGPSGGAQTSEPSTADLPADEVFAGFREADKARDIERFEQWALEIDRRRLLENLSRDEIEARLGKEHGTRWVYLDQEAMEARSFLTRWMLKRGDYWYYSTYISDPYVQVTLGLAFDGNELAWTYYGRYNYARREHEKRLTTYYAFVPRSQPTSNANQNGAEP